MITRTLVTSVALVLAQQVSQPAPPTAVPAGQPRPAVPIATTVLLAHPDQFTGSTVSLTAAVTRIYGPTAFAVAQANQNDRPADVLIVAAVLTAPVQAGSYVTIIGDVIRFDAATLAVRMKDGAPALTGDVVDRYRGKAAIIATSVINSAMTDLAKRLPPPMTPEEEAYSRLMKQVGPAYNTLRQAVAASSAADVATQATALKSLFTQAAPFWKAQGKADAMQWVDDARKTATAIELAATATNWDAIKTDVPKLQQICGSCHTAYRERLDDGTYRYKGPR
jgi:cytochrome c556